MDLDYNKPDTWCSASLHAKPLGFSVSAFQKKINDILGFTENGMPVCRLIWAADIEKAYSKFYSKWSDITGEGTETELRAKYRYATLKIPGLHDTYIDIPPPRWIIEEHNSYGQGSASWEAARWDENGREIRPPMPLEGYYSELLTIADHDEYCCEDAGKMVCWGKYRLPAQADLNRLQRAKHLRDKDHYVDPTKPLSAETLALIAQDAKNTQAKIDAQKDTILTDGIDENFKTLIENATGVKSPVKEFSFSK